MNKYLSDWFFHFVGHRDPRDHAQNYDTLKRVLNSKCVRVRSEMPPAAVRRDLSQTLMSERLIEVSQTCFAEIRPEHLDVHVSKYGHFGIGLGRELMVKYGARPVLYIPMHRDDWQSIDGFSALKDIEAIYRGFLSQVVEPRNFPESYSRTMGKVPESEEEAVQAMLGILERYFLAYIKPFSAELPDDHRDNFYAEREWRSPLSVHFRHNDVRLVIVHRDYYDKLSKDFPALADRCRTSDHLDEELRSK